jgi:diguanylate cyclase (GGDEF)-like protein/putative nucleotidyltransferase with HDIG domain
MNSYSIIQFVTLIAYIILIIAVLRYAKTRPKALFIVFLVASAGWSLSSFLAHADFDVGRMFWIKSISVFAQWAVVAHAHFIAAFVRRGADKIAALGYAYLGIGVILILLGHIPQDISIASNGIVAIDHGPWLYYMTLGSGFFVGCAVFLLVRSFLTSLDTMQRNRMVYLIAGVGLLIGFGLWFESLPLPRFPVDHIGHLGNALMITYALMRHQLLDVKVVVRKGLVYSGVTIFITAAYLLVLYSIHAFVGNWLEDWSGASIIAIVVVAILMAWLFNPLRNAVQRLADRLLYGKRYDYREMVRTFSHRMSNILELEELAEAMLRPLAKAVHAKQVSLLLPGGDYFSCRYAEALNDEEPVISMKFRTEGPIVARLSAEAKPLTRDTIHIDPRFKAMWETERKALEAADVELLIPMKSKRELVGILAMSRKPRGFYSDDDIDMLSTLGQEAAVVIENAQLYADARQRADTDGLTGLYNHRYFHQRLDEEIARCSRFGETFSLLLLDLDLFKAYNDVHGHQKGDDVLKLASKYIRSTIRTIDISFRFGGDEFAVILPGTPLEGAHQVGERIRNRVEADMDLLGIPLTCCIGVASWPADGVMREELMRAADAALYYCKNTGRNRICLASEVVLADIVKMKATPTSEKAILSTIYALAATVDAKDSYTYGHSKQVAKYATEIANALNFPKESTETIRASALLHDIGKIGVSDQLLEKDEPLTSQDWEPIRAHPGLGVAILKHVESLKDCLAAVQYHHERYDGAGYPAGLMAKHIPIEARILAVADAYDAMTSDRPYRAKSTHGQAMEELQRCAGKQFDPMIVDVFIKTKVNAARAEVQV